MAERKIIFKCRIGSHLYGTNDQESDEDFAGVFLPSTEDLLGLQNCPTEWTFDQKKSAGPRNEAGDVDCKFFSLKQFFNLAAEGQPGQLEMFFAPQSQILVSTPEWESILGNKNLFLSKNGIRPFIGFALSQAHKAVIKGENYNSLMAIQGWGSRLTDKEKNVPVAMHVETSDDGETSVIGRCAELKRITNDHNFTVYEIAGRKYDVNLKTKTFLTNVDELIKRYGSRTQSAATKGYDYKSLSHAVRLLDEAQEFLETGNITLPLKDAEWIYLVKKQGEEGIEKIDLDWFDYITLRLDRIRQEIEPKSPLPDKANISKINQLCMDMLREHLK